jgi:hypothetical protein
MDQVHDPFWLRYCDNYMDSATGRLHESERRRIDELVIDGKRRRPPTALPDPYWQPTPEVTGQELSRMLMRLAQMAHSYYVSPTMQVLVTAASHDWPEDEPLREDDFPQPQGWLLIPGGGMTTLDIRGRVMVTNVVMWNAYGGGVDVHYLSDKHAPADTLRVTEPEMWELVPRYTPWAHARLNFGEPLPRTMTMGKAVPPEIADQIKLTKNEHGMTWFFPEGWSPEDMAPHEAVSEMAAWLVSCLRIMQQPLASVEKIGLPAAVRKKLSRYRVKMRHTLVTVIEYRRVEGEGYNHDTGRQLSHRYFRRGHWRRQGFKNEQGEWEHKVIRIQPQIVGDPRLPLKLREHVNALIR